MRTWPDGRQALWKRSPVQGSCGPRRVLRLRGRDFRDWLSMESYAKTGRAANGEALASALGVLSARARFDGRRRPLNVRFAWHDGAVWIDLADDRYRSVRVSANGWSVEDRPPLLFRRFAHTAPLPQPTGGGKLSAILDFVNVRDKHSRLLLPAWITVAPVADVPRPALVPHGVQGSAKTTLRPDAALHPRPNGGREPGPGPRRGRAGIDAGPPRRSAL